MKILKNLKTKKIGDPLIRAIIESPKGSTQKYDLERISGNFVLTKLLPQGMAFPFDFGFIPGTIGQDCDPLDIVVIAETGTFTGCALDCRIIGCLICEQVERNGKKVRNDRYIAISKVSLTYSSITHINALPKGTIADIESFFITYNKMAGKALTVKKRVGPNASLKAISAAKTNQNGSIRLELLLPALENNKTPFPKTYYEILEEQLTERFGGVTIYARGAVEGKWNASQSSGEPIIVYELLLPEFEPQYWRELKKHLEKKFNQQEIMIIHGSIAKV